MADRERNYEEELENLLEGVAEHTLNMSDEEISAEIREEGGDPERVAEETRDVLRRAVKAHRQRKLVEAQARYDERTAAMVERKYSLPDSIEGQREMLMGLLARNPQMQSALLTAQHRDFKDLPDSEVTSYLNQLQDLGALAEVARDEEEG